MDPSLQLALSLLTLVLTPVFSGLVVAYQLSRSHAYWREQQEFLKHSEEFKLQVDLFKRASLLVNRLNDQVAQFHVYASSRDVSLGLANALNTSDAKAAAYYQSEFESFRAKAAQSYLEWRSLSFQLSELAAELSIYFGLSLHAQATELRDKAKSAIEQIASSNELVQIAATALAQTGEVEAAKKIAYQQFFARSEALRPVNEARALLAEIMRLVFEQRANSSIEGTHNGGARLLASAASAAPSCAPHVKR